MVALGPVLVKAVSRLWSHLDSGRIGLGWFAVEVDVAGADEVAGEALFVVASRAEVGAAFAVGDGNRQDPSMPLKKMSVIRGLGRWRSGLRIAGAVALELWPVFGAGDDVLELGDHLAAVADPK